MVRCREVLTCGNPYSSCSPNCIFGVGDITYCLEGPSVLSNYFIAAICNYIKKILHTLETVYRSSLLFNYSI